eukprot:TRINITY_DN21490_c0_g1_i4.p3 TRINITY_DN21490_c0_g1~~TRINITY_DN21490_c0_g1_i4.p3  ORF type:complete len:125 (+),score=9.01 TRINITY_DN21490_c0_g1_i4:438-812(+)
MVEIYLNKLQRKKGIKINMVSYDSSELLNEAFRRGKVDVMIFSGAEVAYKIKIGFIKARMVEENIAVGAKAYPFVKNNERSKELRMIVTKAIKEMKEDGSLAKIYEKWYGMDFGHKPKSMAVAK